MFNGICDVLHREMERLDEKYSDDKASLTTQDLDHMDKMAHTLKSLAGYEAMLGGSGRYDGDSYARGRSRMTGRYISRDEPESYRRY